MPPKGRGKKATASKSYGAEVDSEFPPIDKILQDKAQAEMSGRKKANVAGDETITVGQIELHHEVEEDAGDVGRGISNGTKMNGGDAPNNQEKEIDPFDKLLQDSSTKNDDWRLEFSPDTRRMPENGAKPAEKESEDPESSDEEDFKSNGETLSDEAEVDTAAAKEEMGQVTKGEIEEAESKDEPEEETMEKVPEKRGRKKAVEKVPEEETEETATDDEPEEPNVEVERVPEKRSHKKTVEKAPEEEIEDERMEEPEKVVGRLGRKKAEVAKEEPKKVLAKRGRKKAEVIEEVDEVADDEIEEEEKEKPMAKRGRKKAEVVADEVDDDETEEKPVAKRGRKKAEVVADDDDESEDEKPVANRGRKKAEVVADDDDESEEEKPVAKRGRKKREEVEKEKTEVEPPKSKRGRKKAEVVVEDIADEESEKEQEKPTSKRGRRRAEPEVEEIPDEESEQEQPKAKRGRPKAAEIHIEDSEEQEKPREMRGRKKVVVELKDSEEPVARRGRKKAEIPEVAGEPEKVTGKRGRKRAEAVEIETVEEPSKAPGKKGRKRKADVPESLDAKKKGQEAFNKDDISDFAGRELRVAMTRNHEIDEMARKASPPHLSRKEAGNVQKPSDETYVKAKPAKEQPTKSGRKRANQDDKDSKPEKVQKDEPAKQGKSGAKKAQIPDVSALDFGSDAKTSDDQPWNFKIASWNVNGIRAWLEKDGLSYLEHEDPDILCIQETKCSKDKLPKELQVEGYHCHWLAGDKEGYSGVGLMSKTEPISITEGIDIEEHDNEGRVITAEYEKFYLVTSYVPNSGRGLVRLDYRKTWDEDFRAYLKKLDKKKPVVLCGDLNVAHEEIDIANPKSNKKSAGFTQEERDGFSALLEEGFIDTFRHLYPEEKGAYTFWTYMMNSRAKNVGWRLDYFVISERFKDHLCDSLIRKDVMGSDHCPVGLLLHI